MVYQGSKNRSAKYIVPILQKCIDENCCNTFIDVFCGGANIVDKIKCENKIGIDFNEDLISLLQYAQIDNELKIAPEHCSFEHYREVRADKEHNVFSQNYRALIGYMASYGGRYFDGGYGRNPKGRRSIYEERLNNFRNQTPNLNGIDFLCMDYKSFNYDKYRNSVIYLDPPYKDTKQYSKQSIDYDEFYSFCKELAKDNFVFISEYSMPGDFKCIWQKERKVLQKSDRVHGDKAVEKLFICGGGE